MSGLNKAIKTLKIFSGNSFSIINSSAKVIRETILTVNVNGERWLILPVPALIWKRWPWDF